MNREIKHIKIIKDFPTNEWIMNSPLSIDDMYDIFRRIECEEFELIEKIKNYPEYFLIEYK